MLSLSRLVFRLPIKSTLGIIRSGFLAETITNWFTSTFPFLPKEMILFFVSMIPIVELRGGLIVAPLLHIPMIKAILFCIAGNLLPIPFILLFINKILELMKRWKYTRRFALWLEEKQNSPKADKIKEVEFFGLLLFVGIPLPGTGAWTGALIASLLGIKLKKAVPAILLGLFLATAIMCFLTYGIPWVVRLF